MAIGSLFTLLTFSLAQIALPGEAPGHKFRFKTPVVCMPGTRILSVQATGEQKIFAPRNTTPAVLEVGILSWQSVGEGKRLLALSASQPVALAGSIEISTERASYAFDLPTTSVDRPIGGSSTSFRSLPVLFTLPSDEPLDTIQYRAGGSVGSECRASPRIIRIRRSDGTFGEAPHSSSLETELRTEVTPNATVFAARFVRDEEPMTCALPFKPAQVVRIMAPGAPPEARAMGAAGTATVVVALDSLGAVLAASVQRSSGNALLDNAILRAAKDSKYLPEIARCRATPSHFLFEVDFTVA